MAVPTFQHYYFKKAIYSTTLKSPLVILLYNLTVVRVLPVALLRQSKKSTAPYHAALGYSWCPGVWMDWFAMVQTDLQKRALCSYGGKTISQLFLSAGAIDDCWTTEKRNASLLQSTLQFCNVSCILLFFLSKYSLRLNIPHSHLYVPIQFFSNSLHLFLILCSEWEHREDMQNFIMIKIKHAGIFCSFKAGNTSVMTIPL